MEIVEVKVISSESVTLDANESLTDEQTNDSERNPGGETDRQSLPYTIYTVEVMQVYKGAVTVGNTIEMKQLGGTIDHVHYVQEDAMTIEIGNTYIMFLETYENSPASLINPIQGIYEYTDGIITGNSKNTWVLTLEDIKE